MSYQKRVKDIGRIYEEKSALGIPNREIWRRYVYPRYAISERTFYNIICASVEPKNEIPEDCMLLFNLSDDGTQQ